MSSEAIRALQRLTDAFIDKIDEQSQEITRLRAALDEVTDSPTGPHRCEAVDAARWFGAENEWLRGRLERAGCLVEAWRSVADDEASNRYSEGYGDALYFAAEELAAVLGRELDPTRKDEINGS